MQRIYLHGLGQTPDSWDRSIAHIKPAEDNICHNLVEMLRGQEATYRDLYAACSKEFERFQGAIDLCGLSLGAVLALNYAIDHPEKVHSLVLIAAPYKMPKKLLRLQNLLFRLMPKRTFQQTGFGKAAFLRLCATMAELDFSRSVPGITCPVLVLCGEKDRANQKAAVELAGMIRNAELRIIPGAGHEVNTEAPEALAGLLHGFYRQL